MNWFIVLLVYFTSTAVTAGDILLTQPDSEYRHYVYPSRRFTYNVVIKPTQAEFVETPSKYTPKIPTRTALPNDEVQGRGNLAQFDPKLFTDLVVTHVPTYVYNAKNSQKSPKKFIPTDNEPQFALPEVVRLSDLIRLSGPNEYRYAKRAGGIRWGYKDEYQGKLSSRRKRSAEVEDGEPPELGSTTEDVDAAPASDALYHLEDHFLGEGQEASEKDVNSLVEEEISEPGDDTEAEANENEDNDAESQVDDPKVQKLSGGADTEVEANNDAEGQEEDDTTDQKFSDGLIEPRDYGFKAKVDTGIEDDRKEVTADLGPVVTNAEENGDEYAEVVGELHQAEPGEVLMMDDTGDDLEPQPEALEGEAEPKDNEDEGHAILEEEPETDPTNETQSSDFESTFGTEQEEDNIASMPHDEVESIYEEPITGFEEQSEAGQTNVIEPSVFKSTSGSEQAGDDTDSMQQNKGESIDKESRSLVLDEEPETSHKETENTFEEATTVFDEEPETGDSISDAGESIPEEASTGLDEEPKIGDIIFEEGESIPEEVSTGLDEEPEDEPQDILTTTLGSRSADSDETKQNIDEKYLSDAGTHDEGKEELRMLDPKAVIPETDPPVTETSTVPTTRRPEPQTVRTTKAPITTTQQPLVEIPARLAHRYGQIKNDYTETVSNNVKNYIQARSVIADNLPPAIPDSQKQVPPSYVNEQRIALLRFQECIRTRSMGQSPCSLSAFLAEEYAKTTTPGGLIP